jgi:branched-chain amino acid transport system permease protein
MEKKLAMGDAARWRRAAAAGLLLLLPLLLQGLGDHWVRIADSCLLYVMLALGMNVIVGYAGLLDLGFVAFYGAGAYLFALLASSHLSDSVAWIGQAFPGGLHTPWGLALLLAAALAALCGAVLGAPTLKLRGDYLAVVTLGFGEIVRVLLVNLDRPVNLTGGPKGVGPIDSLNLLGLDLARPLPLPEPLAGWQLNAVTLHYYVFLAITALMVVVCWRLQHSRIGRGLMAIRDDEVAARAMGVDTRALKLLAFGLGASFGGVAGLLFGSFQVFVSPEAFSLQESVLIVAMVVFGGIGHIPGVILGAVLLTALPELLRYVVGPLQEATDGRLDAGMLRPLFIALAMVLTMLLRPSGLWPAPQPRTSDV